MSVIPVPRDSAVAIARYGPSVNRLARRIYHISGQQLLARLGAGESGFRKSAVSSAGARYLTQFMPGTRADYIKRYGVDPWASPDAAFHATAIYLRHGGSNPLASYNPGDPSYPGYILGQRVTGLQHATGSIGGGGGGGGFTPASPSHLAAYDPAATLKALQSVLGGTASARAPIVPSGSPMPDFAAGPVSAGGAGYATEPVPQGAYGPSPGVSDVSQQLSALAGVLGPSLASRGGTSAHATGSGSSVIAGPAGSHGGYAYPLARRGKVIGTPYTGTHTLGNWQSDNAIDISVPVGTGVRAIEDGRVVKISPHPQDGGRFAGDQVTIRGVHGGTFYTHLSSYSVRVGQRVRRGQQIGRSGSANGVAHLHIGRERGNPQREFG